MTCISFSPSVVNLQMISYTGHTWIQIFFFQDGGPTYIRALILITLELKLYK